MIEHDPAFADASWRLATGGLKTLTAKRELPPLPRRRTASPLPAVQEMRPAFMFWFIIIACLLVMFVSGCFVLFVALQP